MGKKKTCVRAPEQPKAYMILTKLYILRKNSTRRAEDAMTMKPRAWRGVSSRESGGGELLVEGWCAV